MAKEKITFTKDELDTLTTLQQDYVKVQTNLGTVAVQRIVLNQQSDSLNLREEDLSKQYEVVQSRERKIVQDLNEKYGAGNLNPETGVFTPTD